jgi:hypothetical protein
MKQPKPKLNVRVLPETARTLDRHPRRAGTSRGAVVDAAIASYCSPEKQDDLIHQRLDHLGKRLDRIGRDQRIAAEMIALFVRYYLSMAPTLSEDAQRLAKQTGAKRFDQFVERVTERVANGGGLVTEIAEDIAPRAEDFFTDPKAEGGAR